MRSSVASPAMTRCALGVACMLGLMVCNEAWAEEGVSEGNAEAEGACELTDRKREMLSRVNEARGQARQCGDQHFEAAEPLTWNCTLEAAAEAHSRDMAENDYFSHTGPDGVGIQQRVSNRDYVWRAVGENIAAGQMSIAVVVDGWLESPGHCRHIMQDVFTEMGMAKVDPDPKDSESTYSSYWTQVLAQPR